jgi:hypothetical protein
LGGEHGIEGGEVGKGAVGERFVGQRPEAFRRLQFGGVRWEPLQVKPSRDFHLGTAVPAGLVEHKQDVLVRACPHLSREVRQGTGEGGDVYRGHQQPVRGPCLRLHEAIDVFPFIARPDHRPGPLAPPRPDAPQDRLQPYPVLVFRPEFDPRVRKRGLERLDAAGEALGKAA